MPNEDAPAQPNAAPLPPQPLPSFLSTLSLDKGGYVMPKHQVERFQDLLSGYSTLRQIARVDTVKTDHFEILTDENTADCGWVTETQNRPSTSTPTLKTQKILIHEMYAKPKISQKLFEDSAIDIESWLLHKVAEKMAALENEAFLYGTGNDQPKGLLDPTSGLNSVALDDAESLISVQDQIHPRYTQHTVWLMSPLALSRIRHMKDPTTGQFLWQPSFSENHPQTLLGHKIFVCDQLGTKTKEQIVFGSFYHGYQIVDRLEMNVTIDPYSNKPFIEYYVRKRTGGDVCDKNALCTMTL